MSDLFAGDRAHARRSDPATSHRAADVVTPVLNAIQRQVEQYAKSKLSGFLDVDLVAAFPDMGPSTLRTRRSELSDRNIILDSGKRQKPDGASSPHTVWIHRDYVAGAPPVCEPKAPTVVTDEDRKAALDLADKLDNVAGVVRNYGLVGCEDIASRASALLRRLAG